MKKTNYKHQFALFLDDDVKIVIEGAMFIIRDERLVRRMLRILRLSEGDSCFLFNRVHVWLCTVATVSMKEVVVEIIEKTAIKPLQPKISWAVPLLEADDFKEAVYALTAMGAFSLQPIITAKSHRQQIPAKEMQRLERIMIAAAEQAKQYALPIMHPVITLSAWLTQSADTSAHHLFFDPQGMPCLQAVTKIRATPRENILCLVGPEGDLTSEEKIMVRQQYLFVALTESILRASHAITVGMGILRSCLR